ncbi:Rieske (2Fe-2S) protein [Achromobacter marplatensis]|uniref:Rieske (2Fe-2S) protein n=1 Tax=Achromobacter marplatensis TaxID=470868 RepID=UPI0039F70027
MTSSCPAQRNDRAAPARKLCRVADIPDGGALSLAGVERPLVLVRRGDTVWGYADRCPHFSVPLAAASGIVLTYESQVIMCAHHSALFRFEDGHCIEGPCQGAALDPQALRIQDGCVYAA